MSARAHDAEQERAAEREQRLVIEKAALKAPKRRAGDLNETSGIAAGIAGVTDSC